MEKNIGKMDEIIRFLAGIALFYLAFTASNKWLIILFTVFATISILESFTGYCGLYKLFNINTRR